MQNFLLQKPKMPTWVSPGRADLIVELGPVLVAWQRTREAIGRVDVSQPGQLSAAMNELLEARAGMEKALNALLL